MEIPVVLKADYVNVVLLSKEGEFMLFGLGGQNDGVEGADDKWCLVMNMFFQGYFALIKADSPSWLWNQPVIDYGKNHT